MPSAEAIQQVPPAQPDRWHATLAALWEKESSWSQRATALKKVYRTWTGPFVILGFAGVVVSSVSPLVGAPRALSILGPLLVTIAGIMARTLLGPKNEQGWVKARVIAESLKAEGFIYAAGAPPYLDRDAAPQELAKKIDDLTANAGDMGPLPDPNPDAAKKHPSEPLSVQDYIDQRAKEQVQYLRKTARENDKKLGFWRIASIALTVVSAGLAAIAGVWPDAAVNAWVGVVSTALATITTFVYA